MAHRAIALAERIPELRRIRPFGITGNIVLPVFSCDRPNTPANRAIQAVTESSTGYRSQPSRSYFGQIQAVFGRIQAVSLRMVAEQTSRSRFETRNPAKSHTREAA